jgi:hypothetical protein
MPRLARFPQATAQPIAGSLTKPSAAGYRRSTVPDTTPDPSDQATAAGRSAQPALDAVQVALDRRDNGGQAATAGHRRINCAAAGNDHLGRRTAQA